jgi:hypothetical protein
MNNKSTSLLIIALLGTALLSMHAVQNDAPDTLFIEKTAWCTRLAQSFITKKIDSTYYLFVENASLFVCYSVNDKYWIDTRRIVRKDELDAPKDLHQFVETFFKNE